MTYKLPDSKNEKDWIACLILSFKTLKGFEYDDREWDKVHWSRTARTAKLLLSVCKDLRTADECLNELSDGFIEAELSWTLETILRHSTDWMLKKRGNHENRSRQRFFDAIAQQRTKGLDAQNGELIPAQSILDSFRIVRKVPHAPENDHHPRTGSLNDTLLGPALEDQTNGNGSI